jgi:NTP pyrophosphatase (non-canonical NTP hydrolase)
VELTQRKRRFAPSHCNLVKKLERARCGGPDHGHSVKLKDITPEKLRDEVGGIFIYLDLLASLLDVDIEEATVETFNNVSEKIGSAYRLRGKQ